jgi:trimethylamine--corrinoid protein Co-methyltransferase
MYSTTPNNIAFPSTFKNQLLADEQLIILKNGTLQLLDEVGVHFPSHRALEIFSDHGDRVDMHRQIIRIPPDLVKNAMATVPRASTLGGREKRFDLFIDGNCSYIGTPYRGDG